MNKRGLATIFAVVLGLTLTACYSGSRPGGLGTAAPDFTVSDGERSVSLHAYRGRVVVLNFWATWCPPCIEEMPSLIRLQSRLKDRVTVLAVSVDVDANAYRTFLKNRRIDLLTVRDGEQKSNTLYGTSMFPESYVIDREGKIRRKFVGAVNWDDPEIEQYLKSL